MYTGRDQTRRRRNLSQEGRQTQHALCWNVGRRQNKIWQLSWSWEAILVQDWPWRSNSGWVLVGCDHNCCRVVDRLKILMLLHWFVFGLRRMGWRCHANEFRRKMHPSHFVGLWIRRKRGRWGNSVSLSQTYMSLSGNERETPFLTSSRYSAHPNRRPNADLDFEVELLAIGDKEAPGDASCCVIL